MDNSRAFSGDTLFTFMAIATGVAVSCIYLNQPLLQTLGRDLNTTTGNIGLIASFTQIGYALGLFFLIPLGDIVSKKKLIIIKQILLIICLILAGVSRTGLRFFFI